MGQASEVFYMPLKTKLQDLFKHHSACIGAGLIGSFFIVSIAIALKLGFGPTLLWDGSGNIVVLSNIGTKPLSSVVVSFSGGDCTLSVLPENSLIMNLHGESPISLSFVDAAGTKHGSADEIYLEPGYKGTIDVSVDSNYKVTWKNNTEPFPAH